MRAVIIQTVCSNIIISNALSTPVVNFESLMRVKLFKGPILYSSEKEYFNRENYGFELDADLVLFSEGWIRICVFERI